MWKSTSVSENDFELEYNGNLVGILSNIPTVGSIHCPRIALSLDRVSHHFYLTFQDRALAENFVAFLNIDLFPIREALELGQEIVRIEQESEAFLRLTFADSSSTIVPYVHGTIAQPVDRVKPEVYTPPPVPEPAQTKMPEHWQNGSANSDNFTYVDL